MNNKNVYYSCGTWLSYQISQRYYGDHYVWCTPYFDPASRLNHPNSVPPTSNPREIYWNLLKEVQAGDLHSAKIAQNRAGIQRGAGVKLRAGLILASEHKDIIEITAAALPSDFSPLLYVIPGAPVAAFLQPVALQLRASPLSEEYILERLPTDLFDAIEL
jgi:hypothetical protein